MMTVARLSTGKKIRYKLNQDSETYRIYRFK